MLSNQETKFIEIFTKDISRSDGYKIDLNVGFNSENKVFRISYVVREFKDERYTNPITFYNDYSLNKVDDFHFWKDEIEKVVEDYSIRHNISIENDQGFEAVHTKINTQLSELKGKIEEFNAFTFLETEIDGSDNSEHVTNTDFRNN